MIIVKSSLDGDVRRFAYAIDKANTFQQFKETIARLYSLDRSVDFLVKYRDEEGDAITISTSEELQEALTLASGDEEAVLRITVLLSKGKVAAPNTTAPAPAPVAPEPERTPPPLKYLSTSKPAFTQTPASQQMLDKASTFFSTLLWDRLFTQPEFQEKFRAVVREAMSTPAFADLLQSIAADMHPATATPTMAASTSTLATETSTAATSTEEVSEAAEIAEFEKLKEPAAVEAAPAPAPEPTPALAPVVPEPKKEEPAAVLPTAPTSPPIDIPNRRNSQDPAIRRSPSSGVFGFITSLPSALSNLVSPHAADQTNPTPAGKRPKEELAENSTEYDGLLAQLVDMGFNDRDANLRALKRTKGNLERAVERLLRKAPKTK